MHRSEHGDVTKKISQCSKRFVDMDYCVGPNALEPENTDEKFAVAEITEAYKSHESKPHQ